MQSAPKPHNEKERLESLYELDILNTNQEQTLDELTELASELCETPVSLVTLIDDQRQYFKSRKGLDVIETPREISFCAHAILENELMIVPDTHQDPRFFDNPLVTGPYQVRFYAGFPLTTEGSKNLGTLCVVDMKPRKLTAFQIRCLQILGHQAAQQLELLRYLRRLDSRNREFQAIMQSISQGIFTLDRKGVTQREVSAQLSHILGVPAVEPQTSWTKLFAGANLSSQQKETIGETLNQVFQGEAPASELQNLPDEMRMGQERIVAMKWDPILDKDKKLDKVLVTLKDVTQTRQLQEQRMILSEKMATIGELVDDLSHELRNAQPVSATHYEQERQHFATLFQACGLGEAWKILESRAFQNHAASPSASDEWNSAMRKSHALIETLTAADSEKKQTMQSLLATFESFLGMMKSSRRTLEITQSVLNHARTHDQKSSVSVRELMESSLTLLEKKAKSLGVVIQAHVDPGSTWVVNKSELNQVLLNLIKNSLEAFEVSNVPPQDRVLKVHHASNVGSELLTIEDNAGGIPAELAGRIFERRLSTKGEKGHGLGLSLAQTLVLRNGGSLTVTSRDGRTTFTLTFPSASAMPKAG